jgi:hypothetical protein
MPSSVEIPMVSVESSSITNLDFKKITSKEWDEKKLVAPVKTRPNNQKKKKKTPWREKKRENNRQNI